jgi:hypothetical protein
MGSFDWEGVAGAAASLGLRANPGPAFSAVFHQHQGGERIR